ncbi:MAG: ester cyclase [Maritimibacter sp.]|jgi:predicted ester cyclase
MSNALILAQWFRDVWIEGDLDAIDRMFPAETEAQGMMSFSLTAQDFKELVPAYTELVDDFSIEVINLIEHGPWVAALIAVKGTHSYTGTAISFSGQLMAKIENGLFVEVYNNFDFITFFEQIGALPPDTIALALSGEPLVA